MKIIFRTIVFVIFLITSFFISISNDPSRTMTFVKNAEAIIGMPFSPLSVAGVARRTTRRAVVATSATTQTAAASSSTAASSTSTSAQAQPATKTPVSAIPIGTVVSEVPKDCNSLIFDNVSYYECSGAFYKTAISSNNLVYVVVPSPL